VAFLACILEDSGLELSQGPVILSEDFDAFPHYRDSAENEAAAAAFLTRSNNHYSSH
jgi:hypothetical protein